jgi:hypothetical protein
LNDHSELSPEQITSINESMNVMVRQFQRAALEAVGTAAGAKRIEDTYAAVIPSLGLTPHTRKRTKEIITAIQAAQRGLQQAVDSLRRVGNAIWQADPNSKGK